MKTSKPVRKSLVEAQSLTAKESLALNRRSIERAVLVAVEFTGERRRLTAAAAQARKAAAVIVSGGLVDEGRNRSSGRLDATRSCGRCGSSTAG